MNPMIIWMDAMSLYLSLIVAANTKQKTPALFFEPLPAPTVMTFAFGAYYHS